MAIHPNNFFRQMPVSGGYRDPIIFAVINYILYALLGSIATFTQMKSLETFGVPQFFYFTSYGALVMNLITSPIFDLIGLFIFGAIYLLCFKIVGGSGNYEGTIRIFAYTSVTTVIFGVLSLILIFVIPPLPMHQLTTAQDVAAFMQHFQYAVYYASIALIVSLYSIILAAYGGKYVHNISMLRSIIALILPVVAIGLIMIVIIFVISFFYVNNTLIIYC